MRSGRQNVDQPAVTGTAADRRIRAVRERADGETAGYTPKGLDTFLKSGIPAGGDRDDIVCQEKVKRFLILLVLVIAAVRIRTQGTAEADIDGSDLRLSRCFIFFL